MGQPYCNLCRYGASCHPPPVPLPSPLCLPSHSNEFASSTVATPLGTLSAHSGPTGLTAHPLAQQMGKASRCATWLAHVPAKGPVRGACVLLMLDLQVCVWSIPVPGCINPISSAAPIHPMQALRPRTSPLSIPATLSCWGNCAAFECGAA